MLLKIECGGAGQQIFGLCVIGTGLRWRSWVLELLDVAASGCSCSIGGGG